MSPAVPFSSVHLHRPLGGCAVLLCFLSTRTYDRHALERAPGFGGHQFSFLEVRLDASTVATAAGADAVCVFVNDLLDRQVPEYSPHAVAEHTLANLDTFATTGKPTYPIGL